MEIPELKDVISKSLTQQTDLIVIGHRLTNLEDRTKNLNQIEEWRRKNIKELFLMLSLQTIAQNALIFVKTQHMYTHTYYISAYF